jgi:hypothetical protein
MILLEDRLSARDLVFVAEFIDVGELGLALEQMADALCEDRHDPLGCLEVQTQAGACTSLLPGGKVGRGCSTCVLKGLS